MKLPEVGDTTESLASYLDYLVREAVVDPRRVQWLNDCEENLDFYLGEQWDTTANDDTDRVVLNRVQNSIISLVALQAGDPPKIAFTPRESGEPPLIYLNTESPSAALLLPIAQQMTAQMGVVFDPAQPLPPAVGDALKAQVDQMQMAAMAGVGMPIDENVLAEVSDAAAADALQTVFDGLWEASDCQRIFVENVTNKNIFGWQPTLYEFDDDLKQHVLTNVHPKQVFIDPLQTDSSRWQFAIFDQPVSAEEAKSRWPEHAKDIDQYATQGRVLPPGAYQYDQGSPFKQYFYRDMINVRTAWIRFQPYPMTPDQAVAGNHVAVDQVATDITEPMMDEMGNVVGEQPIMRQGFFTATGEEINPQHPNWPMRYGIRQVTAIRQSVVDDRECEHIDIPLPVNKNVPLPNSPYGQGEPARLKQLQVAINRLLSAYVTHHRYNAYPPEFVPSSVVDRMDEGLKTARTKPNQRVVVPDDLIQQFGDIKKIIGTIDTPTMPTDFWQLLNLLIQLIDKEGNQSDVMQGNASATWSGTTVKALQTAASQIIQGKSIYTEFYLKRLARLMVHSICYRLTPEDWKRYVSKYPPQALEAIHAKAKSLDVDISVEIKSASGASRAEETNQLVALKQQGSPISDETIMSRFGLDIDVEQNQQMKLMKKQQENMQALNPAMLTANNGADSQAQQVTGGPQ